jgi:hypothetical protein
MELYFTPPYAFTASFLIKHRENLRDETFGGLNKLGG